MSNNFQSKPVIAKRIDQWKEKLINITRKNRLVYYRPTKKHISIAHPDVERIYQDLVVREQELKFPFSLFNEHVEGNSQRYLPESDDLICNNLSKTELKKALRYLSKKPNDDYKDYGIRSLYIAFGLLNWKNPGNADSGCSPLILCPVDIKRIPFPESFTLSLADKDEISINPGFQVKLKRDFPGFELPKPPQEWELNSFSEYLSSVKQAVENYQWSVEEAAVVGIFSFHKLSIYQDLSDNFSFIKEHPLVSLLAGEEQDNYPIYDIPELKQLDSIQKPEETFQFLEADSSQQRCIQAVLRGNNLVIDGPPGTGKSQTIANIIAEFIARGKTVLFVSAKIAALEVVFNKLKDSNLNDFCLELHSQKAKKKEIYEELKRCLESNISAFKLPTNADFENLKQLRERLNDYVLALHKIRESLGESVSNILGKLTELDAVPLIPIAIENPDNVSPTWIQQRRELVIRLGAVWQVVEQGEKFSWFDCLETKFTSETQTWWLSHLDFVISAINSLSLVSSDLSKCLGVDNPSNLTQVNWLISLGKHLVASPVPDASWLTINDLETLFNEADKYQKISNKYKAIKAELRQRYNEAFLELPSTFAIEINTVLNEILSILSINETECNEIFKHRQFLLKFFDDTKNILIKNYCYKAIQLATSFGLFTETINLERIKELAQLAILCNTQVRPPTNWLNSDQLRQVKNLIEEIRPEYTEYNNIRNGLLERYDDNFFELDIEKFIKGFSSVWWRNKFLRWFNFGFRRAKAEILRTTREPELPTGILGDLYLVRRLKRIERDYENNRSRNKALLGEYDQRFRTNFSLVENAINIATEIIKLARVSSVPDSLAQLVSLGYPQHPELSMIGNQLREGIEQWELTLQNFSSLIQMEKFPNTELFIKQKNLSDLEQWVEKSLTSLQKFCNLIENALSHCINQPPDDLATLLEDFKKNEQWRSLSSQIDAESDNLTQLFGNRYRGVNTDWEELVAALDWTKQAHELLNNSIPQQFIQLAVNKEIQSIPLEQVVSTYEEVKENLQAIEQRFFTPKLTRYAVPSQELSLTEIGAKAYTLRKHINELQIWIDYKAVKARFTDLKFDNFFNKLQQSSPLPPLSQISDIFYKSIYHAWVNAIFEQEQSLRDFYGQEHEQLIQDFRNLDAKLLELAYQRIINECNNRKSLFLSSHLAQNEIKILKRRRQALRSLFDDIPNLLLKLKPCLMMSPLSVSQLINPEKIQFDLVIFDEASQLFTEEAVGAICRGKQFVVAGDNKQLPPTDFFGRGGSEDEDDEEIDDIVSPTGFRSLLDECEAILYKVSLQWHYRSKHESLIAFSNAKFYQGNLITFPSKQLEQNEDTGVKFIHVPEGRYDRGGARNNLIEAQRVVEEILNHFNRYQNEKSLGVITFGEGQMEAIERVLEEQRKEHPEFDRFFGDDLLEGFFVKNLENVQGDERDVIILSVGYGRDNQERMTSNFGPLNNEGGERRLNVAITRARQKFIVVSSITASDINLTEASKSGVLNFYSYLDYAERGQVALELSNPQGSGKVESPFEEDVAGEIRSLGYIVTHQVGCSRYRIDIGVSHPSQPGRFLLGVECDGATYHSAATARDRDRLRQQVLEKLGWKIHRIWSPDWWKRRKSEIERLRFAIEAAYLDV